MSDKQQGIEFLIKVLGKDNVKQALGEIESSTDKAGKKAGEAGGLFNKMGEGIGGIAKAAVGMMGAFFGFQAIVNLFREWYQYIIDGRNALIDMARKAAEVQRGLRQLAAQEGVTFQEASNRVNQTVQNTGAEMDVAIESRRAVSSALGSKGIGAGIQDVVAGALSRTGGTADQATALVQLLARTPGATDSKESAAKTIGALEKAMATTYYSNLGEIAQAAGGGGLSGLIQKADITEVIARQAQARAVTEDRDQSRELMMQINRWSESNEARKIVEQTTGKKFREVGYGERFSALQGKLKGMTPAQRDKLLKNVPEEQRERAVRYFTADEAIRSYDEALAMARSANAADVMAANEAYKATAPAQQAMSESAEANAAANLEDYDTAVGNLRGVAAEKLKKARERNYVKFADNLMQTDEAQIQAFMYAEQLTRLGVKPSVQPGSPGSDLILRNQLIHAKEAAGIPVTSKVVGGTPQKDERGFPIPALEETSTPTVVGSGKQNGRPIVYTQGQSMQPTSQPAAASQPAGETHIYNGPVVHGNAYMTPQDRVQRPPDARK